MTRVAPASVTIEISSCDCESIPIPRHIGSARLRLKPIHREKEVVFSLADSGVGFDRQYAGELFGVFQRLHRIEQFEATGIGLPNVRRIVGRRAGRIWAEGQSGEGATCFLSLPVPSAEEKS